jgi:hypothetical protein
MTTSLLFTYQGVASLTEKTEVTISNNCVDQSESRVCAEDAGECGALEGLCESAEEGEEHDTDAREK